MSDLAQETADLRNAILDDLSGWIRANTPAMKADPRLRDAIVRRVVDDVTDVMQMGGAAASEESSAVASVVRTYLRSPLFSAGLGESLGAIMVTGRRAALRRMKAPEALADIADASVALASVSASVDRIASGSEAANSVPTGLGSLDEPLNGGLPRGELTLLGAGTGDGKTAIAMQIAEAAAIQDKGLVFVCSPEMQGSDLWLRQAMRAAEIPRRELRPRSLTKESAVASVLAAASKAGERTNLVLLDRVDADISAALGAAYLAHEKRGPLYLVVLDYAQQLAGDSDDRRPRYQVVGHVARQALELAMHTGAAVFLTSQINVAKDKQGTIIDTSFRESATIEHKAAVAITMTVNRESAQASLRIRKNRHGPQLTVTVDYRPEVFLFKDPADWKPWL